MLDRIKLALRIDDDYLDEDIQDNIDAVKADLQLCGIAKEKITESDALIVRAIKTFCKAEFSSDDKEANRYRLAYEKLRDHLSLSTEYTLKVI